MNRFHSIDSDLGNTEISRDQLIKANMVLTKGPAFVSADVLYRDETPAGRPAFVADTFLDQVATPAAVAAVKSAIGSDDFDTYPALSAKYSVAFDTGLDGRLADSLPTLGDGPALRLVSSDGPVAEVRYSEDSSGLVSTPAVPFADTIPGDISSVATVAVGGSVDVAVDTIGDHDWYRVTLTAGTTYTIQTSSNGSGTDAFLNLRDSNGALLVSDDDSGDSVNSLISYTATSSGTYFIDAGTYNNETTGGYHLFVAGPAPAGDPVGGTTGTAASLVVGGTVNGNLDVSGDHDFYAINLVAGQTYIFRTAPTATNTTDTILTLRNAGGTQLATNDDAGEFAYSAIRYTATASGTYYLDVSGFNTSTGEFNLSAFTAPTPLLFTNDQISLQLTNGYWGGTARHWNVAAGGTLTVNLTALTTDGQFLAREALNLWTDAIGVTFSEVAVGGQIVFDDNQTGAFANSTRTGSIITAATVNVGTEWLTSYGVTLRTYSFQTYVHEIGHALGLGHAGNYNGSADYSSDSLYLNDSWATTIMSYFDQTENTYFQGLGFTRQFAVSPMIADLIAVANLYGANTLTRTGNTTYGFNNNTGREIFTAVGGQTPMSYTVVDNGGTDTLDYSGYTQAQRIDLNAETFSNVGGRVGNVSIARGTVIENAIGGSGADILIGNAAANQLDGGGAINTLSGNAGNDRLLVAAVGTGSNIDGGADTDTLVVSGTVSLGTVTAMEAIEFVAGSVLTLLGSQFNNGFSATSVLSGTGSLIVQMASEVLFISSQMTVASTVATTINGSTGIDVIKVALTAAVTINGGDSADQVRGSNLNDVINGQNGDDKIMGLSGADDLTGGAGVDQFRFLFKEDSLAGSADRILDFTNNVDKLDFRLLDADLVAPGRQTLNFIGTSAFAVNGTAQVRYADSGGDTLVQVDLDGNGVADMQIVLVGHAGQALAGTDFLF